MFLFLDASIWGCQCGEGALLLYVATCAWSLADHSESRRYFWRVFDLVRVYSCIGLGNGIVMG